MHPKTWLAALAIALSLTGTLVTSRTAADSPGKPASHLKHPAGTGAIMGQLRTLFKQWDLDGDGYLDKEELAKAFGYTKPFDYKRPSKDSDKDADKAKDADKDKDKPASKPSYSARPDYQFLVQLDKDNDEKISYDEYLNWARTYAVQLKKVSALQAKITKAEARLEQQLSQKARRQAQSNLNRLRRQIAKMNGQAAGFDRYLRKVMKGAGP
ncbi:MAG TPA: EF-hand domain-containing protein [Gemmataceae bacterium]|jgi:Ca2+-binding EF-hand superfamily protein|nr:EF-hand domain-containing protein [Gemmataceae bacterium]